LELGVIIAFESNKKANKVHVGGQRASRRPFFGIRRYFFFSPPRSAKEKFLSSAARKKEEEAEEKGATKNKSKTHKTHHHVQQFPKRPKSKSKQTST
jgi:hypothetical protein